MKFTALTFLASAICLAATPAIGQQQVRITFENRQPADGFYLTPVFAGFHDGSFDIFNAGEAASGSLEALAEEGIVSGLQTDFNNSVPSGQQTVFGNPAGFDNAPVLDPGEAVSQVFSLDNNSRFFNFATMVIPTNDAFFGNDNAIELLDSSGNFTGNRTIDLTFANIWDAGTEVNDGMGAAFSTDEGVSSDEGGVTSLGPDLSNLNLTDTADGTVIDFASASSNPFLRVTISAVPEPSAFMLLATICTGGLLRRRRK